MISNFYSEDELVNLGFAKIGKNVLISRNASIYGEENIEIGNNVRIDDFCILSGKIKIGNYVHIAAHSAIFAGDIGVEMMDFSEISSRVTIYAISDSFSGEWLTNPTVPDEYRYIVKGKVILEKHVVVGAGSVILPSVRIGEGSAIGSMSLVNKTVEPWGMYVGIPCRFLKGRKRDLLGFEHELIQ